MIRNKYFSLIQVLFFLTVNTLLCCVIKAENQPSNSSVAGFGKQGSLEAFLSDYSTHPLTKFTPVAGEDPNGWHGAFEPYAWAMGLDGQATVRGLPPVDIDLSAKKTLQHLDWGTFAKGELTKGRWGILADGYFAQLSAAAAPNDRIYSNGQVTLQQGIASLALSFRLLECRQGFLDTYAGARYNYLGMTINTTVNQQVASDIAAATTDQIAQRVTASVTSVIQTQVAQLTEQIQNQAAQAISASKQAIEENISQIDPGQIAKEILVENTIRNGSNIFNHTDAARVVPYFLNDYRNYVQALVYEKMTQAAVQFAATKGGVTNELLAAQANAQKQVSAARASLASSIQQGINARLGGSTQGSESWVDPIIGLRAQINFTRVLFWTFQGDVGGFSAGSQFESNVQTSFGANLSRRVFAEFGYRYMYVDYQNNGFLYKMNSYGLFAGLGVKF